MYYTIPRERIFRRKSDGRWCCELTIGIDENTGKHIIKYLYGKTRNEVRGQKHDFLENWDPKSYTQKGKGIQDEMQRWLYEIKINSVKPSTFDRLEQTFQYQILPALKEIDTDNIEKFDVFCVQKILNITAQRGYSESTQKKTKDFLTDFFNFAMTYGITKTNPAKLAHIKKDEKIIIEDDEDYNDIKVFNEEEIELFKKTCYTKYKNGVERFPQAPFLIFMLNTGIRAGEALATRYSDIDFETGVYKITKTATTVKVRDKHGKCTGKRERYLQTPKTKNSSRKMKLNPEILQIIKELKAREPENYNGLILHGPNGEIFGHRSLEKRFYSVLDHAGIKRCGIHTLRHTFASMAYKQSNGQIELVSKLLGHCDPAFTARIYVKIFDEYQDAVMNGFII